MRGITARERAWERAFGWKRLREARQTLERFAPEIPRGGRVLDLGCGRGYASRLLEQEFGCEVICCDVKHTAMHASRHYCLIDGQNLPFRTGSFGVVFIAFVLHHVREPVKLLEEARRVCNGPLLVVEDTPRLWPDRVWGDLHPRSFSKRTGIGWCGQVRLEPEWRRLFKRAGLAVHRAESLSRWERLPPVSRTAFVLEPTS